MAKYSIDSSTLTDIADAIRTQYGEASPIAVTDMAEAILGIEGGGGEANNIDMGDITFTAASTDEVVIEHSLGEIPQYLFVFPATNAVPTGDNEIALVLRRENGSVWLARGSSKSSRFFVVNDFANVTNTTITMNSSNKYKWLGIKYKWIAIAEKGE